MKVQVKLVLLLVCLSAGLVFGAAKGAKDVKVEPKDTKAAQETTAPAKETAVKAEVKAEATEAKPEVMPTVKAIEPNITESNGVAATVNGVDIMEKDVDAKVNSFMERAAAQIPPNMVDQYKIQVHGQVLESMIIEKLLDDQIKSKGIKITDEDVNNRLNEIATQRGTTVEQLKEAITAQGQSMDEVKDKVKKMLGYEKLPPAAEVNDADAKAYYEENQEDFNQPEQVKASHILVKVAPTATPEDKAAAKAKIEGLLKQVKAGGDFAQLARENSDCPSKANGGDLGFFRKDAMVKEFSDAAFAMKVGEVSNIVETQFGYHIIKVTDRKEAGMTSFEKAKPDIIKNMSEQKKQEGLMKFVEKTKADANIVYPPGKEPKPRMPMMQRPSRPGTPGSQSKPSEIKPPEPKKTVESAPK